MPTVETNGIETYYEDYGSGQPVVVLHGGTADHQVWAEQLQPLTDTYRIIPYDLRGHGHTGESDRDTYTVDLYVADLAAFIHALDLDQPVILGHSLGGMIGYLFADAHPEDLSALITVGAATPQLFSRREWAIRSALIRVMASAHANERLMNGIQRLMVMILGDDAAGDVDTLQQIREAHGCDAPEPPASEQSKVLRAASDYHDVSRSLSFDTTPVLMLYGENEPFIESHANYLNTEFETCQTVEIPDASHNAQVDNPDFIETRVRTFLENQSS